MSNDNHSLVPREDDNSPIAQVELLSSAPDARDITAELAAPPRRRLPWVTLALAGGVLAAAAFSGGVWYQQNHGTQKTAAGGGGQQRATGQGAAGGFGGQGTAGQGAAGQGTGRRNGQTGGTGAAGGAGAPGGTGAGGFTRGTVKVVDGTTVYLTDANGNTVKVTTGDSTKVQLNKEGKVGDLQPGQSVTVVGTPDASGAYAATQLVEGAATGGFGGFGGARTPSGG
ncbi:hypothetical protein [Kitasatospora sp. NPDC057015]|uniref:hypothetical protein n=1 Tax=Kitasatospora sp. NPDC057015 TaxID=3346001 RepID=UPI0036359755